MAGDVFANESELDMTFNTEGTTADDLNSGGLVTKECHAHLLIANVKKEAKPGKVPCLVFDMQVLAADAEGQKGKFIFHRINLAKGNYTEGKEKKLIDLGPLTDGAMKSLLKFALGLQLITAEQIGAKDLRVPWSQAAGKQCMSHLRHGSEYTTDSGETKKGQIGIQFGEVYPVDDERVKDWPKDAEATSPTNLNDF